MPSFLAFCGQTRALHYEIDSRGIQPCFLFFIYYLSQKNTKTKKQTERTLAGTPQQLWPITAGPDTNKKKIKTRNIKKHSDTRKTTATYNKLLDETRDEHYYILNR